MSAYILGIAKQDNKCITNRGKMDYKQGQFKRFKGILDWGKEISNWGKRD